MLEADRRLARVFVDAEAHKLNRRHRKQEAQAQKSGMRHDIRGPSAMRIDGGVFAMTLHYVFNKGCPFGADDVIRRAQIFCVGDDPGPSPIPLTAAEFKVIRWRIHTDYVTMDAGAQS
jgi:hypothetical protein